MSSFYGIGVIADDGRGTTNYNELDNRPIINLTGVLPVDFSSLGVGVYNVTGNYKYGADDATKTWDAPNMVYVFKDTATGKKVLRFDVYENGARNTLTLVYENDGTYTISEYLDGLVNANSLAELPAIGDKSQIYITKEDGIYIWDGQEYKQLGSSGFNWGTIESV